MEQANFRNRHAIIKNYFSAGFSNQEILAFLSSHDGLEISLRQLHKYLRRLGLFRRRSKDDLNNVILKMKREISSSSSCFGYRLMHQKLRQMGVTTDQETVKLTLKALDPEGVICRSRNRLKRRMYISTGPNNMWHIDGYDKLKPFGFSIHGRMDGYSRKIIWLKALPSNNGPKIIADIYIKCISKSMIVPKILRADRGSENVLIGGLQRSFRREHGDVFSGVRSFRYGSSTANQRIGAWWSILRRSRTNWWINYFKDMMDEGIFDSSMSYHVEAIRFYMGILQNELNETISLWNSHRIRPVRNAECPGGRPDVLYFLSGGDETSDCSFPVTINDFILGQLQYTPQAIFGCTDKLINLATIVLRQEDLSIPQAVDEAKHLYLLLINSFQR